MQLRTLIQVAKLGSLSKAADRVRIAQPALSRQIRMLEEELDAKLFERHGRGMVITEPGHQVLAHAVRIMAGIEELRAELAERTPLLTGRVVIGMPPTVGDLISVPLVAALRQAHPHLALRLVSAFTGHLLDWLQRGEADLVVLYDPQPTRSLRSQPLLTEALFLIGPRTAAFSMARAVPFRELAGQSLLLPGPRHGLRAIVERCAVEARTPLRVDIEADTFETLKDLVRHGYRSTILPLAPIASDIAAGRLTAAPLIDPAPDRRLVLAFPSDRPPNGAARAAAAAVTTVVTDLVQRGAWAAQLVTGQRTRPAPAAAAGTAGWLIGIGGSRPGRQRLDEPGLRRPIPHGMTTTSDTTDIAIIGAGNIGLPSPCQRSLHGSCSASMC